MLKESEILHFISEDKTSMKKQLAKTGQKYYEAEHDILQYRLFYYNADGKLVEDTTRSNMKIPHPFFTELVDQAVQYMLSGKDENGELKLMKSDLPELQTRLDEYFDDDFISELSEVLTGTSALLIARTEGHRIQQSATLDACHVAKDKGADVVKQWDSTLDRKTRKAHMEADGQIRELDEPFDVWGEKLDAPAVGGSAKNVCNCRCVLLQRAKWSMTEEELEELKKRADFFGLNKDDSFDDFRKKYLNLPANADSIKIRPNSQYTGHPDCKLAKALGADDYERMLKAMDDNCSEESVRKMWDIFEESVDGDFQYKGHEHCSGSRIYVNVVKDAKGSDWQSPFQVICHESGHMIDSKSKKLNGKIRGWGISSKYQDGIFQKTLKEEIMDRINVIDKRMKADYKAHKDDYDWLQKNGYIDSWTGAISKYSKSKAYYEFEKEIRSIPRNARGDISDIVEGATKGKVKAGFGHGNSYWKDDENLALEAFAEMTDATLVNPENLEQIKKYVPKSYEIYLEIVDLIVKGS